MSFDTIEILSVYTADGTELFITDDEANDEPTSVILKDPTEYAYDTKLEAVESYAEAYDEIASEAELSERFDDMVDEVSERHHNHLEDGPAMAEWFNRWTDSLTKSGELHPIQYDEYTYVGSNAALRNHGA